MYIWIIKRPNILAHPVNISVAFYVEEISEELSVKELSVTPCVANFQGYRNLKLYQCLQNSYSKNKIKQNTHKKNKQENSVYFTKSCCSVFFIVSLMTSFSIAVPWSQRLSMRPTISLLLENTIDLLLFYGKYTLWIPK